MEALEVPLFPGVPSSAKVSIPIVQMYLRMIGGISSRSNRNRMALVMLVGPQSYRVVW